MRNEQGSTTRSAAPRTRRPKKPLVGQPTFEIKPEFEEQGMSNTWQEFYSKVKQATQNS